MNRLVTAALAAVLLSATPAMPAGPAYASGANSKSLALWGILGWGSAVGVGASFQLPLVPQGLIHDPGFRLRDSLDLDLGFDDRHVRDGQEYRAGVVHGSDHDDLADLGIQRGDRPINRRLNSRLVEVVFNLFQRRFLLFRVVLG